MEPVVLPLDLSHAAGKTDEISDGAIAILLAAYNGEQFLLAQLQSLLDQRDCPSWQLFWRDDGSQDRSAALIAGFASGLAPGRVRQIAGPESTIGSTPSFLTLLAAAPEAAGLFAFCDQDDVWLPHKLARARAKLAAVPPGIPALYCAKQTLVDDNLQPIGESPKVCRRPGFANALVQNIATGCTVMLNRAARALILAAPPVPEGTYHDWWCYLLVSGAGGVVIYDPEPVILYRQHQTNAVGAPASFLTRAMLAARRGPGPFLQHLANRAAVLQEAAPWLTPAANRQLRKLRLLTRASLPARLLGAFTLGLYRQQMLEDITFRLWFVMRELPAPAAQLSQAVPRAALANVLSARQDPVPSTPFAPAAPETGHGAAGYPR